MQKQIRDQYGSGVPITQAIERLVQNVDQNTTGIVGGIDVRLAPLIDYGQIETLPDIPKEDQWLYTNIGGGLISDEVRSLPEELFDLVTNPSPDRVAIVGELGRVNALHVLATEEVTTFDGDATVDAKLLSEHQHDLMPFLSASIQNHGVRKTLLNVTAAIQQYADEPKRQALHADLDQAWQKLPDDIAFKHAERLNGALVHLQELVAAQKQIREQYGNEDPITQSIGCLVEHVNKNTT